MSGVPAWVEWVTAALVVASGLATVVASLGFVRLASFFDRMHPPALASSFGTWAVVAASIVYFSALEGVPVLHAWVIPILLAITVPVTTVLVARTAIFRRRRRGADLPPPLSG
ncbi:MAG: Na+/H+ antiporter subunit G [Betaproteobacteria bacterium PRO3]|nr:Na+/H+ antiporter subunit G [Betaproteobacteria bacterium PRO3]